MKNIIPYIITSFLFLSLTVASITFGGAVERAQAGQLPPWLIYVSPVPTEIGSRGNNYVKGGSRPCTDSSPCDEGGKCDYNSECLPGLFCDQGDAGPEPDKMRMHYGVCEDPNNSSICDDIGGKYDVPRLQHDDLGVVERIPDNGDDNLSEVEFGLSLTEGQARRKAAECIGSSDLGLCIQSVVDESLADCQAEAYPRNAFDQAICYLHCWMYSPANQLRLCMTDDQRQ